MHLVSSENFIGIKEHLPKNSRILLDLMGVVRMKFGPSLLLVARDSAQMRLVMMARRRLVPHPRSLSSRKNWRIPRLRPRRLWKRPRRLKTRRKRQRICLYLLDWQTK